MHHILSRSLLALLFLISYAGTVEASEPMRLALVRTPKQLDPFTYLSLPEWYVHFNITATLVRLDHENQIVSGLAKKWSVSNDGRTYKFVLDTDRKWSDGTPLTARQILDSLIHGAQHKNATLLQKLLKKGPISEAVRLEDATTLVLNLEGPVHNFLYHLARPEFGVVDVRALAKTKVYTERTKTSGNYKIRSISDEKLVLVPNPRSSVEKANPQTVEFIVVKDYKEALKRIESGGLDFYEAQSDDAIETALKSARYQIVDGGLDNLATLQARNLSRDELHAVQVLGDFLDKSLFSESPKKIASRLVAYSIVPAVKETRISAEDAKQRLNHKTIRMTLSLGEEATKDQLHDAQLIQREAAKIGIQIQLEKNVKDFR